MKIARLISLLTVLSCCSVLAQTPDKCFPLHSLDPEHLAFKAGEELIFAVHYRWGPINSDVAKARLTLDSTTVNGVKCYHSKMYGKTPKTFDMFFRIREDFQSWFSMETLTPVRFTRDTHEGNYECTNDFWYNWDANVINATLYSSKRGHRFIQIPLVNCVYDIPSLIYVCRNIDFKKVVDGSVIPLTFSIDDEVYTIKLRRIGKENKTVRDIGTVRTVKFNVSVIAGEVFDDTNESIHMWFTDDENRIPVMFDTKVKWGAVVGHLSSYGNLNHPFSSKISN